VQPGPIDTDLNPAAGDWAVPQKAATALDRLWRVMRSPRLVRSSPGRVLVHHGANLTVDGGMNPETMFIAGERETIEATADTIGLGAASPINRHVLACRRREDEEPHADATHQEMAEARPPAAMANC